MQKISDGLHAFKQIDQVHFQNLTRERYVSVLSTYEHDKLQLVLKWAQATPHRCAFENLFATPCVSPRISVLWHT